MYRVAWALDLERERNKVNRDCDKGRNLVETDKTYKIKSNGNRERERERERERDGKT